MYQGQEAVAVICIVPMHDALWELSLRTPLRARSSTSQHADNGKTITGHARISRDHGVAASVV
jgi:hypothetical protein